MKRRKLSWRQRVSLAIQWCNPSLWYLAWQWNHRTTSYVARDKSQEALTLTPEGYRQAHLMPGIVLQEVQ